MTLNFCEPIPGLVPLFADQEKLYASDGYTLKSSSDDGTNFETVAKYDPGLLARLRSSFRYSERLFREGFHALEVLPDGSMVGIVRKEIVYRAPGASEFQKVFHIERGSRPLNLCLFPDGEIAFGEYFSNGRWFQNSPDHKTGPSPFPRDPVRIFSSRDGQNWDTAYMFSENTIRHIHGVFYDKFRDCAWVLTGDLGDEAGIWVTYDRFKTLEPVARGTQSARAATLIVTEEALIAPMDSNLEPNFIYKINPATGEMAKLADLPGPAISSAAVGDTMLVSTMVDYTELDQSNCVSVLASISGGDWTEIANFERMSDRLTHPRIVFATMRDTQNIYAHGICIKDFDGTLMRWMETK